MDSFEDSFKSSLKDSLKDSFEGFIEGFFEGFFKGFFAGFLWRVHLQGDFLKNSFIRRFCYRIAKPLFLPLQIFAMYKTVLFFELYWESSMNFKMALATPGRLPALSTVFWTMYKTVLFFELCIKQYCFLNYV